MYFFIVFLPGLASLITGLFGRFLGKQGTILFTTGSVILSSLISLYGFYHIGLKGNFCYIKAFTWIDSEMLEASWGFMFDSVTITMCIVVTIVSSLVHIYSTDYMKEDPHLIRFMTYLSMFTFFMLMLVTADNFVQMFLGWEGVGLCSYLLINFWYTRIEANKAAIKAIVVNRVGDFGLSLGMFGIFLLFKGIDFSTVYSMAYYLSDSQFDLFGYQLNELNLICFLLFIGAVGKSAQIGLHTWLPDAMEGPTPVSALIHAATMVTAGVFLIIRCSPIFEFASNTLLIVTFFGALTALFAATAGAMQNDLKKVIAYSTCSQLGYMVFACGISNYSVSLFHLMNHAFFKALLFLSSGAVIHAMSDQQDMRKMGGLIRIIPFTYAMIFIGSLSLMGFPFLTGFYSKDVILELAYAKYSINGTFAHWLGTVSAALTGFYSLKLLFQTFLGTTRAYKKDLLNAHDVSITMAIPLIVLTFGSIFVGFLTKDIMIGLGTDFWSNSIFILPSNLIMIESEFIPIPIKLLPVVFSLSGATAAYFLCNSKVFLSQSFLENIFGYNLYLFSVKKWHFDHIYNNYIVKKVLYFSYYISFKTIDRGVVELIGPFGLANLISNLSQRLSLFQTGFVYHYAFIILVSVLVLVVFICLFYLMSFIIRPELYIICLLLFFFKK